MSSNQSRDAIVIALDVGKSVSTLHEYEDKTFFQSSRNCVSWIIQRKIISQSVDVLSLLLIGSNDSDCPMVGTGYDNISGKFDFQVASWDMLKFIEKDIKTSNVESDWLGALIVSLEMLKAYEEFNNVSSKKIVIFSDFTKPTLDDLGGIIKRIKTSNIELTIIGPEHLYFSPECDDNEEPSVKRRKINKSLERQEGEKVVHDLWRKLPENVAICTFQSALKQLCSYAPKPKRPSYWNCIMDIGDINISISIVKKTDPKQPKKFNTKFVNPSEQVTCQGTSAEASNGIFQQTAPAVRDTVMHYKHETGQNNEFVDVEVQSEDTVEGFRYGKAIIPFTKEDKAAMKYESGPKSFSVIGFTQISRVPYYLLSGECCYLVVPREKDKNAEVALSALIQGLKKMKCLAIVRRVYSLNLGLSLGILYPTVEEIFSDDTGEVTYREYLLFIELAFEEDVKSIDFPSLETVAKNITQQQYDAVDCLIDGMNLMKADKGLRGEACEAFDLTFLHDYKEQFFHYCVIQKGLHPDKSLPSSLPPYIANFIKVPEIVKEKCRSAVTDIKTQFKIKKASDVNSDATKRCGGRGGHKEGVANEKLTADSLDQAVEEHFSEGFINEETNPVTRAWMRLFGQGFPTNAELERVLIAYREAGETEISQAANCFGLVMTQIRASHLKRDPIRYNRWITGFKNYLSGKDGLENRIWEVIVMEHLGLITKEENQMSELSTAEGEKFFMVDVNRADVPEKKGPDVRFLEDLIKEVVQILSSKNDGYGCQHFCYVHFGG